jgi:hypothetical protein
MDKTVRATVRELIVESAKALKIQRTLGETLLAPAKDNSGADIPPNTRFYLILGQLIRSMPKLESELSKAEPSKLAMVMYATCAAYANLSLNVAPPKMPGSVDQSIITLGVTAITKYASKYPFTRGEFHNWIIMVCVTVQTRVEKQNNEKGLARFINNVAGLALSQHDWGTVGATKDDQIVKEYKGWCQANLHLLSPLVCAGYTDMVAIIEKNESLAEWVPFLVRSAGNGTVIYMVERFFKVCPSIRLFTVMAKRFNKLFLCYILYTACPFMGSKNMMLYCDELKGHPSLYSNEDCGLAMGSMRKLLKFFDVKMDFKTGEDHENLLDKTDTDFGKEGVNGNSSISTVSKLEKQVREADPLWIYRESYANHFNFKGPLVHYQLAYIMYLFDNSEIPYKTAVEQAAACGCKDYEIMGKNNKGLPFTKLLHMRKNGTSMNNKVIFPRV